MKGKFKAIKMLIGMLKKKNQGIFICKGKKETLQFANGNIRELIFLINTCSEIDKQFGDMLTTEVLCDIIAKGEAPAILNEKGRRELIKILSEDTMKQDQQ